MGELEKTTIKFGYIYKTTNLINNKIYIGQHTDSKIRKSKKLDSNYLGSGLAINNAIKYYGRKNFKVEIIEWCNSKNQLNEREIYWINKLNSQKYDIGYNIANGSQGGNFGQDYKLIGPKISAGLKGKKGSITGRHCYYNKTTNKKIYIKDDDPIPDGFVKGGIPHTKEEKEKISKSNLGKIISEETRKKISISNKGRPGYIRTDKQNRKNSESHKGYITYTNGIVDLHLFPNDAIPLGFHKGSKMKNIKRRKNNGKNN